MCKSCEIDQPAKFERWLAELESAYLQFTPPKWVVSREKHLFFYSSFR